MREPDDKGTVYLIHFVLPFKHAQHYIGWTRNMPARMRHHRRGTGSKLLRAVARAGIDFFIARTWENADGNFERQLHNRKSSRRLCPICLTQTNPKETIQ